MGLLLGALAISWKMAKLALALLVALASHDFFSSMILL